MAQIFGYLIMPLTKLQIAPGIDKQNTEYGAEGRWVDGDNIRFRYGQPEKIGGWEKVTSDALLGATRAILTYSDLKGVNYAVYGTNKKLYAYSENVYADITPTRATGTGNITQFETTNGSTSVIVTDSSHGALIGDFVTIASVSGAVGGISAANLQGEFEIQTVPTGNTYTIIAGAAASSDATGATANATYQINTGLPTSIYGYGWGAGTWNASTWNTSREGLTGADGVLLQSGKWSLDNWGEDVLAQQFNGSLYYWDTSSGLSSNLAARTNVSNAPTKSRFMLVSGDDRHVICFGTETTIGTATTQDNMFIRFSDQEDPATWTPTATNTAGSQRLTDGNQINAAVRSRGVILIYTDTALYQMQFIGPPFTFGFRQLGTNCGAVGIKSAVDVNGIAYWMGNDSFFLFDGAVKKIPCSVQDYVFDDINNNALGDVFCAVNSDFNEVIWFYPSKNSTQIDRNVTYNYAENIWYIGTLARSSWADRGVYSNPYAAEFEASDTTATISTINGVKEGRTFVYLHEEGVNDDGAAMNCHIESGDIDIADGDNFMSISRFIPDFKNQIGEVDITLKSRPYPSTTQRSHGPFTVTTSTNKKDTRIRGRQLALRVSSDAVDDKWRYGTLRFDAKPDGMRGG
jgi:hypothetical protein|tara:strand:- start:266 stop:2161 length:1896 start_codon:yes stop_codon:yes gene_type:complete